MCARVNVCVVWCVYIYVCVCACVRACVCVCVRVLGAEFVLGMFSPMPEKALMVMINSLRS